VTVDNHTAIMMPFPHPCPLLSVDSILCITHFLFTKMCVCARVYKVAVLILSIYYLASNLEHSGWLQQEAVASVTPHHLEPLRKRDNRFGGWAPRKHRRRLAAQFRARDSPPALRWRW
jgi:hypothetical protein